MNIELHTNEINKYLNIDCPCKRTNCERYGKCDECRAHHHGKNSLTKCEKIARKEQRREERQQRREERQQKRR